MGASTLPKPRIVHMSAYLGPRGVCIGPCKHCLPSLVHSSTHSVSNRSSFCGGSHPVSFKTASSVSFFASSCVFAVRMLAMDAMTSASLPCKSGFGASVASFVSLEPLRAAGGFLASLPFAGGASVASRRSGVSFARSGSGFSLSLHSSETRASISFLSGAPSLLTTFRLSVSRTVKSPAATPAFTWANTTLDASLWSRSPAGKALGPKWYDWIVANPSRYSGSTRLSKSGSRWLSSTRGRCRFHQ
mmetsp:Transcript_3940/g.9966  ORF Transcript_3940/g.9966 Transcript_3940/m.9966 type:complete len:246 (+) Transcript_3940:909-1646(+)